MSHLPPVTVPERVAVSLRAMGATGQAWLDDLPGLLTSLAADWSITLGARLDGGRAAYVAETTTAVLKVAIPPYADFARQLSALQLAGGDPYVRLLRHDTPRRALLLERLGAPMASLGRPVAWQVEALTRTAARGWRRVPADGRLPTWAEAARWHADFIPAAWEELGRPCSQAAVDLAVRCAAAREAAADPDRAVLVHGDVHALNALQTATGFRLIDPIGLVSEPAHDLGVIQARGVPGRLGELAAGEASAMLAAGCAQAGRITGVDPDAIRQWACMEIVSTGLHLLRLGDHREAETYLTVADKLAPAPSPTLVLMVGLPGAGKTTRAQELAATRPALRLTPDEWMISLYDGSQPDGKRDLLEGRLITVALQALRLGTDVVLDFGLWSRDERSALRWLAAAAGASAQVVYLPVDRAVQLARITHRQATAPHTTFPMTEADLDLWHTQFQPPDPTELGADTPIPAPPPPWPSWPQWAAARWPSLNPPPSAA